MLRATTAVQMKTEVAALSRYRHPSILQLMGYYLEPPCLVFPFMARLSLYVNLHDLEVIKVVRWHIVVDLVYFLHRPGSKGSNVVSEGVSTT